MVPNILTEAQHFFLKKDYTTIGRKNEGFAQYIADVSLKTADRYISKNHCQLIKKQDENGGIAYYLSDATPSKNGTYYNTDKNTTRLEPHIKIRLKDGDFFWVGNTKIIFHNSTIYGTST
ncbi:MAG: FHA domain-containing protein [Niabella sp.]